MSRENFAPIITSSLLALIVLIVGLGVLYFLPYQHSSPVGGVVCTQEAKQCPDGSYVGRTGQNCEFAACPMVMFCGGIATGAFPCPANYNCKLDGNFPDAGGHCVKN